MIQAQRADQGSRKALVTRKGIEQKLVWVPDSRFGLVLGDFPDWILSKELFRVVRINAFKISRMVTVLVTVDVTAESSLLGAVGVWVKSEFCREGGGWRGEARRDC